MSTFRWLAIVFIAAMVLLPFGPPAAEARSAAAGTPAPFGKLAPLDGMTVMTLHPTLRWGTSAGVNRYEYCYDTTNDSACDNNTWLNANTATSVTLNGLSGSLEYYWQVRAVNSSGTTWANGGTYWSFMTGPIAQLAFTSAAAHDGHVLESSELSGLGGSMNSTLGTFTVGDNALRRQFRAILSFDTSSLSDTAMITTATLKVKKAGGSGTNPFSMLGNIKADIRKGAFGGSNALQLADFNAAASKNAVLTFTNTSVAGWYSKSLASGNHIYINRNGYTQFRLRFSVDDDNDGVADFLKFYSGNAATPANRPVLVIEYYEP